MLYVYIHSYLYIIYYIIYIQIYIYLFTFYLFRNLWNTFICRNFPSFCMRSIASVTRRMGLDRKKRNWEIRRVSWLCRKWEINHFVAGKVDRTRTSIVLRFAWLFLRASQSLPRLWPFPSVVSLGALNRRPFSVRSLVFSRPMYVLVILNSVSQ